ncbi:MAG: hypothetical protein HYV63_15455 [Candidatus Schekmanbacteria bacterium]|nr:hypothetical protein [Candidatus Schekmanbacteria bacterium]
MTPELSERSFEQSVEDTLLIALHREHRQALITAAVTGKIDVRNEAP